MSILYNYPILRDTIRVVDGDTIECMLDKGHGMYSRPHIRLLGIDCPELRKQRQAEAAWVASRFTWRWLHDWPEETMLIHDSQKKPGKYGRSLGDIHPYGSGDGGLVAYLLAMGVAVPAPHGHRHDWTDEELARIEAIGKESER